MCVYVRAHVLVSTRVHLCVSDAPARVQLYMRHVLKRTTIYKLTHVIICAVLFTTSGKAGQAFQYPSSAQRSSLSACWHDCGYNKPCVNLLHSSTALCLSKGKQSAFIHQPKSTTWKARALVHPWRRQPVRRYNTVAILKIASINARSCKV